VSPPAGPDGDFSGGSLLPGVVAGFALPVVGVLLAFLLGLGLVVWSGVREDEPPDEAVDGTVEGAGPAQAPAASDR
jgi:hypothetical protein